MAPSPRWRTANYQALLMERWEDEVFLFNPASGHTHLLNAAGAELLAELARSPADLDTLCARFYDPVEQPDRAAFVDALANHLRQLALIGLIEAAP